MLTNILGMIFLPSLVYMFAMTHTVNEHDQKFRIFATVSAALAAGSQYDQSRACPEMSDLCNGCLGVTYSSGLVLVNIW